MTEPGTSSRPDRRIVVGVSLAFWTLIGLITGAQRIFYDRAKGLAARWWEAFVWSMSEWYIWAALSYPIYRLVQVVPIRGRRWWLRVLLHVVLSFAFALVQLVLGLLIDRNLATLDGWPASFGGHLWAMLIRRTHVSVMTYWAIAGVFHAFGFYRQYRERQLQAAQLETRLAEARLEVLRMQLNPHFLFNTLNTICALMRKTPDAAEAMITRLSDLLRQSLDGAGKQQIALREELDLLKPYIEIEKIRFADRLTVEMDVDPGTLDVAVPSLVLQPLVENAIRHGIAAKAARGTIRIGAHPVDGHLRLTVEDDGRGLSERDGATRGTGIGLANTRARIEQLYGTGGWLTIEGVPSGGCRVTIEVPRG